MMIALLFDILDEDRTGLLTPNKFLILLHTIGLRLTLTDVIDAIQTTRANVVNDSYDAVHSFRFDYANEKDCNNNLVDLNLAQTIIQAQSSASLEYMDLFRLFDQHGFITPESLKQVILQLTTTTEKNNQYLEKEYTSVTDMIDSSLQQHDVYIAMIRAFDSDGDGKMSLADFVRMMES